jgi:hypothetical protein
MEITEALEQGNFIDPQYGMVSVYASTTPGPSCGNYFLFTAQAQTLGYFNFQKEYQFWLGCRVQFWGLFSRWPNQISDISKDEIIGAASLSQQFAYAIAGYGDKAFWCFDLQKPGKISLRYWIGRFPDVVPYVQSRAGRDLWFPAKISWAVGCLASCLAGQSNTSGKLLMMLQIPWMRRYLICAVAAWIWTWRMKRMYPGGPQQVRAIYFGASHPLAVFSPTEWF